MSFCCVQSGYYSTGQRRLAHALRANTAWVKCANQLHFYLPSYVSLLSISICVRVRRRPISTRSLAMESTWRLEYKPRRNWRNSNTNTRKRKKKTRGRRIIDIPQPQPQQQRYVLQSRPRRFFSLPPHLFFGQLKR